MKIIITFTFRPYITSLNLLLNCVKRMIAISGGADININIIEEQADSRMNKD